MARIYLDCRAVLGPSGLHRYCQGLIPALATAAPAHELVTIRLRAAGSAPYVVAPNVRDVQVDGVTGTLPLLLSRGALERVFAEHGTPDLLHAIFHVLPFGIRAIPHPPSKIVVTLHDLIWVTHARDVEPTWLHAQWRRRLGSTAIRYALQTADHVISNSEATRAAAAAWLKPGASTVVYHGVDPAFAADPRPDAGASAAHEPYVAAFGVGKPYKNVACLVEAFALVARTRPRVRLMLLGGDAGLDRRMTELGIRDRVDVRTGLSDDDVRTAMRRASVFVVPSLVEGFGLPALEAMAVGTPLVVADAPALTEVAGDSALTFPGHDPSALAGSITRLLDDDETRRALVARGRARAATFTWEKCAAETLAVYDSVLRT